MQRWLIKVRDEWPTLAAAIYCLLGSPFCYPRQSATSSNRWVRRFVKSTSIDCVAWLDCSQTTRDEMTFPLSVIVSFEGSLTFHSVQPKRCMIKHQNCRLADEGKSMKIILWFRQRSRMSTLQLQKKNNNNKRKQAFDAMVTESLFRAIKKPKQSLSPGLPLLWENKKGCRAREKQVNTAVFLRQASCCMFVLNETPRGLIDQHFSMEGGKKRPRNDLKLSLHFSKIRSAHRSVLSFQERKLWNWMWSIREGVLQLH